MELKLGSRLKHGWNAFLNNRDPTAGYRDLGAGYARRPDRPKFTRGNERTIVTSIYNRMALDASQVRVVHCKLDENGRYIDDVDSKLNSCFQVEANIDQTWRAFMQDAVISMMDEGVIAIVPVDTTLDPTITGGFDIETMRVGRILEWYPRHVKVRVYNDRTGQQENLKLPKKSVAIVENPLYSVVNEPNSTMQRLIRKINLLDQVDERANSGKLDLIIQLPYVVKSEGRRQQAEQRRKDIEMQLSGSTHGIAYTDGTERVIQLNRPVENTLQQQIEDLRNTLYGQLGMTQSILDGSADDKTMLNYYNRTIEPIVAAIVDEMRRKFLTKTARSQRQSIMFFRDPFRLAPVAELAEAADKFTRNEIMSKNEFRQVIGMKPSKDPKADQLINSNINQSNNDPRVPSEPKKLMKEEKNQNG